MCIANIFHWLQLSNHLFLTNIDLLIFLITGKILSSMPPKTKYLITKCCPLHKINCNFSDSITQEQYYKIYWVSIFSCIPIVLQARITQEKKHWQPWWKIITKSNQKELMKHYGSCDLGVISSLSSIMTRCSDPPMAQQPLTFKKTHIFTWTCVMHKSSILHKPGREAWQF